MECNGRRIVLYDLKITNLQLLFCILDLVFEMCFMVHDSVLIFAII